MRLLKRMSLKAVVYGQALGDAYGLCTEFMSKSEIDEMPIDLTGFKRNEHSEQWRQGQWTDDTDQMILLMKSIIDDPSCANLPKIFARYLHSWYWSGVAVDGFIKQKFGKDTLGVGYTVRTIITSENFLENPIECADAFQVPSNGGVMRTAVTGVSGDWDFVKAKTLAACSVTHSHPKCKSSCLVIAYTISQLVKGRQLIRETFVEEILGLCCVEGVDVTEFREHLLFEDIEDFELDDAEKIGYTFKCMGVAFWALFQKGSFKDIIRRIATEGGDADTNCAVAGALLGAKLGYAGLPADWISQMRESDRKELDIIISQMETN